MVVGVYLVRNVILGESEGGLDPTLTRVDKELSRLGRFSS